MMWSAVFPSDHCRPQTFLDSNPNDVVDQDHLSIEMTACGSKILGTWLYERNRNGPDPIDAGGQ